MRNFLIAAALFLAGTSPALAADPATLSCVRDQVSAETAASIRASAQRRVLDDTDTVSAAVRSQFADAATLCQKRHGWSDAATEAASQYTRVGFGREGLTELGASKGIKLSDVRTAIDGLSEAERAGLLARHSDGILAYLRELGELGISVTAPDEGRIYGGLAALILMETQFRAAFAAN